MYFLWGSMLLQSLTNITKKELHRSLQVGTWTFTVGSLRYFLELKMDNEIAERLSRAQGISLNHGAQYYPTQDKAQISSG